MCSLPKSKTQLLSLTILISKTHKVGLDSAGDCLCFQPFPLLTGPPHLHCVSFCLLLIYLDTQKWHHRSSVKSSTFRNKAWCQPSTQRGLCITQSHSLNWFCHVSPSTITWWDLVGGQRTAHPTGQVQNPFLI